MAEDWCDEWIRTHLIIKIAKSWTFNRKFNFFTWASLHIFSLSISPLSLSHFLTYYVASLNLISSLYWTNLAQYSLKKEKYKKNSRNSPPKRQKKKEAHRLQSASIMPFYLYKYIFEFQKKVCMITIFSLDNLLHHCIIINDHLWYRNEIRKLSQSLVMKTYIVHFSLYTLIRNGFLL